jgi:hypothetical protein
MALVRDDDHYFYEVLRFENPECWVAENVIPVLGKSPVSKRQFEVGLQRFLNELPDEEIVFLADWPEDIMHFCQTVITSQLTCMRLPKVLKFEIVKAASTVSPIPHNALADAQAYKAAYFRGH